MPIHFDNLLASFNLPDDGNCIFKMKDQKLLAIFFIFNGKQFVFLFGG